MNINILGEQIARYRKALGMTQEDLGRAVGISAQAVSRWECGGAPDGSGAEKRACIFGGDVYNGP